MTWIDVHLNLPDGSRVTAVARQRIVAALRMRGFRHPDWLDEAALIVTELVLNAVQHAGGCTAVVVSDIDAAVTVAVFDHSPLPPRRREPGLYGVSGLHLAASFGTAWGTIRRVDGKQVWIRLRTHP
ncbi:ATP-binding protein [Dactylosporangium sp. CA-139066]|uniref:ATP-binding protein n=1 Tax=Dactylosporangium sp. CA-139066 TaxID=3239930 RepID=UPI003D8CDFEE